MIGYAVNLANQAVTRYTHWPFYRLRRWQGAHIAVDGGAIVELGGDRADGAPIMAEVGLEGMAFESPNFKRLVRVYLTYRPDGPVEVRLDADERRVGAVAAIHPQTDITRVRLHPPRGPRATYWGVSLANYGERVPAGEQGGSLDIHQIELVADVHSRGV